MPRNAEIRYATLRWAFPLVVVGAAAAGCHFLFGISSWGDEPTAAASEDRPPPSPVPSVPGGGTTTPRANARPATQPAATVTPRSKLCIWTGHTGARAL